MCKFWVFCEYCASDCSAMDSNDINTALKVFYSADLTDYEYYGSKYVPSIGNNSSSDDEN